MNALHIALLSFASFGAIVILALSAMTLAGFVVFRMMRWLGILVRAVTPD
jgi:hypothetical protein